MTRDGRSVHAMLRVDGLDGAPGNLGLELCRRCRPICGAVAGGCELLSECILGLDATNSIKDGIANGGGIEALLVPSDGCRALSCSCAVLMAATLSVRRVLDSHLSFGGSCHFVTRTGELSGLARRQGTASGLATSPPSQAQGGVRSLELKFTL